MSVKHKWHKEIKAWADGAKIECKFNYMKDEWEVDDLPDWCNNDCDFRIKQRPKKPQYLYVWESEIGIAVTSVFGDAEPYKYLGKIKLEVEDE